MSVRRTKIPYADFTGGDANFIIGCTPVSAGCANCYARDLIEGRQKKDFSEVRLYPEKLKRLVTAKLEEKGVPFRRGAGSRPIVFAVDLGDIMHAAVPTDFINRAFRTMAFRKDVDWLILTKRAVRMANYYQLDGWPLNIWPGVTVENSDALWRASQLSEMEAAVKWFSVEPMLGPIDLSGYLKEPIQIDYPGHVGTAVDWIACGGESGAKRRPFKKAWALRLRDQCVEHKIPFFFKQGSGRFPGEDNLLDGEIWHQLPGHYDK